MPCAYICPFCRQNVQIANQLPVGRPVKCPRCQKLYLAGAPGAVGTAPAAPPGPKPGMAAPASRPPAAKPGVVRTAPAPAAAKAAVSGGTPSPAKRRWLPQGWLSATVKRIGSMEWKQLLASCFFLFMLAVIPTIFAWSEWSVSSTASVEPLAVELAQLEKGPTPDNNHIKVGPHTACYFATVYRYTTSRKGRQRPDENTKVDYAFYPILSAAHPYFQEVRRIQEKYRNVAKPPEYIEWPRLSDFRVLVKTDRFRTVGDIPDDDTRTDQSVQGLIINRISTLSADEQRLIKDDFPNIDFNKVLILSEGRRPSSGLFCVFLLLVSLPFWFALFGIPGVWVYRRVLQRA